MILKVLCLISTILLFSVQGLSEVRLADRHMVMIEPGIERVGGSYMFGVKNSGAKAVQFTVELLLPKETVDFGPQDGLAKEDLILSDEGRVVVDKEFPPGLTIMSVGFYASVDAPQGELTFPVSSELAELSFLTRGDAGLKADGFMQRAPSMLPGKNLKGIMATDVPVSKVIKLSVTGVREGRSSFIYLGIIFSIILSCLVIFLTYRKHTKTTYMNDIDEVVEF